jgi:hypothetical protein
MKTIWLTLFLTLSLFAQAQFTYKLDQSIVVEADGKTLTLPWAGGLNSVQVNTMDLNDDDNQDLVLFDRTTNKILTFLNESKPIRLCPSV